MTKENTKLGLNISQEWHDDNRKRFDAETTIHENKIEMCSHYFIRKSATEIGCKKCTNGWTDMDKWKVDKGELRV